MATFILDRQTTESKLEQDILLWHRAYHQFRIVVYYFVLGVEKYTENILEESLELLTTSYVVNEKINEDPPHTQNGFKVIVIFPVNNITIILTMC